MKTKTYKCPFCKSKLQVAGKRQYETLSEHMCDPNGKPTPKDYWKCNCDKSQNVFWGIDGDMYGDYDLYREICNTMKLPHHYHAAWKTKLIGSWGRNYSRDEYYIDLFKLEGLIKLYRFFWAYLYYYPTKFIKDNVNYFSTVKKIKQGFDILPNQNNKVIERLIKNGYDVKRITVEGTKYFKDRFKLKLRRG